MDKAKVLTLLKEIKEEFFEKIDYDGDYDSVGLRVCCQEASYNEHKSDCVMLKVAAMIDELEGDTND